MYRQPHSRHYTCPHSSLSPCTQCGAPDTLYHQLFCFKDSRIPSRANAGLPFVSPVVPPHFSSPSDVCAPPFPTFVLSSVRRVHVPLPYVWRDSPLSPASLPQLPGHVRPTLCIPSLRRDYACAPHPSPIPLPGCDPMHRLHRWVSHPAAIRWRPVNDGPAGGDPRGPNALTVVAL